jgi:hypothetical protein
MYTHLLRKREGGKQWGREKGEGEGERERERQNNQ